MKSKAEILSLLFCIIFSFVCLSFNTSIIFRFVSSLQILESNFLNSFSNMGNFFSNTYDRIGDYNQLKDRYSICTIELEKNKLLIKNVDILETENYNLRREIDFVPKKNYNSVKAEVLSIRLNSIYPIIIVSKGKVDGIFTYMPVTGQAKDEKGDLIEAIVGKVISVSDNYSFVQPIINQNFNMGVQIEDDFWANLTGNSKDLFTVVLNYIDDRTIIDTKTFYKNKGVIKKVSSDYFKSLSKIGKPILSSGGAGVFPKNIPVGVIAEEVEREGSFKKAYVKPYINFQTLKYVNIIQKLPEKWAAVEPEENQIPTDIPFFQSQKEKEQKEEI